MLVQISADQLADILVVIDDGDMRRRFHTCLPRDLD
jgi:hypothetical protein